MTSEGEMRGEARTSVGSPVKKRAMPSAAVASSASSAIEEIPKPDNSTWSNKPSVGDQFTSDRWESFRRIGPPQVAVFDLPAQQQEANLLLARSRPEDAPEILVLRNDPMTSESRLVLFVLYHEVEYKRILPQESKLV